MRAVALMTMDWMYIVHAHTYTWNAVELVRVILVAAHARRLGKLNVSNDFCFVFLRNFSHRLRHHRFNGNHFFFQLLIAAFNWKSRNEIRVSDGCYCRFCRRSKATSFTSTVHGKFGQSALMLTRNSLVSNWHSRLTFTQWRRFSVCFIRHSICIDDDDDAHTDPDDKMQNVCKNEAFGWERSERRIGKMQETPIN